MSTGNLGSRDVRAGVGGGSIEQSELRTVLSLLTALSRSSFSLYRQTSHFVEVTAKRFDVAVESREEAVREVELRPHCTFPESDYGAQ